ncbi:hypothetical protein CPB84DRAFT_241709 [Gymnopilus junonius]|uniref:HMG box domain-containing protein n=1 Tax=Gymnopilus junonius TaxID=109634 RepID=A0A9P5TSK0_GYMJU|nr:hypothetical protein CPB84DRAFT_241709 [Gymnopilus junonius]
MTTDSELDHIARPSNAFILFRSHLSQCAAKNASSKAQDGNNNSTERVKGPTSTEAGMMWKDLDDAERALWKTRADHVKYIHSELHPNYKYKPRSKKDKEQLKVEAQAKKKEKREAKQLERNTRRAGQGAGRGVSTSNTKGRRSSPDVPYPVPPRAQITRLSSAPLSSPPSSPSYMSVSTPSSSSSSSSVPSSVEPSPAFSPRYPSYRGTANLP